MYFNICVFEYTYMCVYLIVSRNTFRTWLYAGCGGKTRWILLRTVEGVSAPTSNWSSLGAVRPVDLTTMMCGDDNEQLFAGRAAAAAPAPTEGGAAAPWGAHAMVPAGGWLECKYWSQDLCLYVHVFEGYWSKNDNTCKYMQVRICMYMHVFAKNTRR